MLPRKSFSHVSPTCSYRSSPFGPIVSPSSPFCHTHTRLSTNYCLHFEIGFRWPPPPATHSCSRWPPCNPVTRALPLWLAACRWGQEVLCERVVVGGLAQRASACQRWLCCWLELMDGATGLASPQDPKKAHEKWHDGPWRLFGTASMLAHRVYTLFRSVNIEHHFDWPQNLKLYVPL